MTAPQDEYSGIEIAVVGMSARFPGADDIDAFWNNVRDGVESVTQFSSEQLQQFGVASTQIDDPDYVRAGIAFDGCDQFDAGFFGYTPREAEQLDPQQRVFLECAWQAIENAGYDTERWRGTVGVYAGDGPNIYLLRHLLPSFGLDAASSIGDLLGLMSGNGAGSLATRVAYKLNLRGPALTVQTACSTSLTAVHLACQSLLSHDCDMALAGGVFLNLLQQGGYLYQPGAILSPDGHCRAFDAEAAGTLIGSGVGVVALKRLSDALDDGDIIHAIIKGTAANNDGNDKVGFTAPSISGQAGVIRAAHVIADVAADTIGYVEAHGTGTVLGDPIEVAALAQAFRMSTDRRGYCALASVKTNIGHLDAAAGIAGLIKTILALRHKTLPPSLNFAKPNPHIDFANSPFYVNTRATPWPRGDTPRRAGVSSFGIGGTNVHVVLEEAPQRISSSQVDSDWTVLPLSARSADALEQNCRRLATWLQQHPQVALADVAHTLQTGRRQFPVRAAVTAMNRTMAIEWMSAPRIDQTPVAASPEVVFLFPGGGAQHAHMGAALYRRSEFFRREVDRCCDWLRDNCDLDLRAHLFPAEENSTTADAMLARIDIAQPALFVIDYAMATWWMQAGVQPALMLGHSLGEYVAACIAGVFTLEDALRIVVARGKLLRTLEQGCMTAIALSAEQLTPYIDAACDIAAINGRNACVIAGVQDVVEKIEERLRSDGHLPRRLHVSIASHSALVEPVMSQLEQVIASVPRNAPRIPFLSNVTGTLITAEQAVSPAYWSQHLRGTVRFAQGLDEIFRVPGRIILEVGPGESLSALARQQAVGVATVRILSSQTHPQQHHRNDQQLLQAIAGLWTAGVAIDWKAIESAQPSRRVSLPTYAFQRQRYWVNAASDAATGKNRALQNAFALQRPDTGFHYIPTWQRSHAAIVPQQYAESQQAADAILVMGNADALTQRAITALRALNKSIVLVERGARYSQLQADHFVVRADAQADIERLLRDLQREINVTHLLHLWGTGEQDAAPFDAGYFSLHTIAMALAATDHSALSVLVVTDGVEDVTGTEILQPEKATVLGIAKVWGQEYPQVQCRVADVIVPDRRADPTVLAQQLVGELLCDQKDFIVAYRGPHRWIKSYEPLPAQLPRQQRLRRGGVYLITGGLGGVGLAMARYLGQHWQAKLVLLGRSQLPERDEWQALVDDAATPPGLQRKLQQLLQLETAGVELMIVAADVTDHDQMRAAIAAANARFGAINGVVHAVVHPERGMIAHRDRNAVHAAFAPKIAGTRALLACLDAQPLDFVVLCSSVASFIGGLGRSDYAAANAFLDAFAHEQRRFTSTPIISVNWDAWRDVGIAVDMDLPDNVGLDEVTGVRALEHIVNGAPLAQVVVSAALIESRIGALDGDVLDLLEGAQHWEPAQTNHARPVLANAYVTPEGTIEESLASLWSQMLGIAPIGASDNMFELGGDSLLAIRMLAQVRKTYGVELSPAEFFRHPTITDLAADVEMRLIDDIELESLTDEIVEAV